MNTQFTGRTQITSVGSVQIQPRLTIALQKQILSKTIKALSENPQYSEDRNPKPFASFSNGKLARSWKEKSSSLRMISSTNSSKHCMIHLIQTPVQLAEK